MPSTHKKSKPRAATRKAPPPGGRTVLVAVCGLSPAVLTETIWALSHENPRVIPDQIIALTTERGCREINDQLFGKDEVWLQLRAVLLGPGHANDRRLDFDNTPDRVKIIHRRDGARRVPIVDLTSHEDNKAIADALVDELWTHTSKPDTRVIASLAGGYKTMSALCLSAMQLLAAPGDRATHVLVGGGFKQARPRFFFPEQRQQNLTGPSGPLHARDATTKIQLIDVPVIPLRRWFEDLLHTKPPSYDVLLTQGSAALDANQSADLRLELGPVVLPAGVKSRHVVAINGNPVRLTPDQFAYLRFFAERARKTEPAFERAIDVVEEMTGWLFEVREREPRYYRMSEAFESGGFTAESLGKRISDLRRALSKSCAAGRRLATVLPCKGRWALQLPAEAIMLRD